MRADEIFQTGYRQQHAGDFAAAQSAYRQVLAQDPAHAGSLQMMGAIDFQLGRVAEAIGWFGQAVRLLPEDANCHGNLGLALQMAGRTEEALECLERAVELDPHNPEIQQNLAISLSAAGRAEQARLHAQRALELAPGHMKAHNTLGNVLRQLGRQAEAEAHLRAALAIDGRFGEAHHNLGVLFLEQGRLAEALIEIRRETMLLPGDRGALSDLLFTLQFDPRQNAVSLREEHRAYEERFGRPRTQNDESGMQNEKGTVARAAGGVRVRVGYVSGDFRRHVVARNILPLLRNHDRERFEITLYSNVEKPDAFTSAFEGQCDRWRDIRKLSDDAAARLVREDGIDILVDLSLHLASNRLGVFAHRPAPVQMTFAGYPGSTGLRAIDYRISDPYLDPVGMDESVYSEKTLRLRHSFWCYEPAFSGVEAEEMPEVNALPALERAGRREGEGCSVTFGSLNNPIKVNEEVLRLWASVMREVGRSRLVMMAHPGMMRDWILRVMGEAGVAAERVEFVEMMDRAEYLRTYHRIDLVLDTFPYNGHTTSLDGLWMGVPMVTLVGERVVSRGGLCQLSHLGLTDWITYKPEEFVKVAVEKARDLEALARLRAELRGRMEKSVLMDAKGLARDIERIYLDAMQNEK
jgi:predicted O-linked N-acetylglucosamine transferase (SPINDLY family)